MCRYGRAVTQQYPQLHSSARCKEDYRQKPSSGDCVIGLARIPSADRMRGRTNRWQHRLNREHPTCTEQ